MSPLVTRRAWLLGSLAAACSRKERAQPAPPPPPPPPAPIVDAGPSLGATELLDWTLRSDQEHVLVMVPERRRPDERFPVVIALHGRGEAVKGPDAGAFGWPRDYALVRAYERMASPPLVESDFEGLVTSEHIAEINRSLKEHPFGRLIVVCPYVPDIPLGSAADQKAYGKFLTDVVLPKVRAETPALAGAQSTGIDGVSLGGAIALRIGLGAPDTFGAVAALQPAIGEWQTSEWTELAKAARAKRPSLQLRLTTSEDDVYRSAVTKTSEAWRAANVAHDFAVLPGPHDYVFNRGPGAIELLWWHDRVLSRA